MTRRAALSALMMWLYALMVSALGAARAGPAVASVTGARRVIDDFESVAAWSSHPADGVALKISSDVGVHGRALRLDFKFTGGGYAVARRDVDLDLPENYRLRFAVKGECLPNDLELKLIDASGDNVWWHNRRGFKFKAAWDSLSSRKRQITFAWGPQGGGEIRHVAAIEIAVTAGSGGTGTVWFDDFVLEPLPAVTVKPPAPIASASSAHPGREAAFAVDGRTNTSWWSALGDSAPWLALDLGIDREFGGIVVDWARPVPPDYAVEASNDGRSWRTLREVRGSNGGRDYHRLPESEARFVRVRFLTRNVGAGPWIRELQVEPLAWGETRESFHAAIAKDAPRGSYPRSFLGEPIEWAVVGLDGGRDEGLLSTDGQLETGKAQFSIEPFLRIGGRLVTWADVRLERTLAEGSLPIPTVTWKRDSLELAITAFGFQDSLGSLGGLARLGPSLVARYRLTNRAARRLQGTLYLAFRPFQVNPTVQFLNTPGGCAPIRSLARSGAVVEVNGNRGVLSFTPPDSFRASTFDGGDISEHLRAGRLPAGEEAHDALDDASGAFAYRFEIAPRGTYEVDLLVPFHGVPKAAVVTPQAVADAEHAVAAAWRARQSPLAIELPDREVVRTLEAQLGWILINRDSAGIQPGSRSYERSWIRDGALTSSALLRLGQPDVVRAFVEWFATYLYPDGKVPCCVDGRGADPVPEHDSGGEFIYLVAEYFRYTGDRATVERLWPKVLRASAYLDSLRSQRRTAEWRAAGKEEFFGLLPPSISHEGYSAKPMHSYWDDFFALRGFKDAVLIAEVLGKAEDAKRLAASRDTFAKDLSASIAAAMARHKIDYIPGCADLGDYDATSTTIALAPAEAEDLLPPGALQRTFEGYWEFFRDRRDGKKPWEAFTPYEVRTIGAFVRLGWRDRAQELIAYFLAHRSPPEWAQWAEVVWNDRKTAHFIGDMPHTWVGSDFVRSVLDLLAYERESDDALVIAAGVPWSWASREPGVKVQALPTPYGLLGYTLRARGDSVEVRIEPGLRVPRGGVVINAPAPKGRTLRSATVNGVATQCDPDGRLVVHELPVLVVLRP